jgi:hypothetical protein
MSAERQTAIRELMRAAERVLEVCGNEALTDDPSLASKLVTFGMEAGVRVRLVVDLAAPLPTIAGEMVRNVRDVEGKPAIERVEMFAVHAAPPDVSAGLH